MKPTKCSSTRPSSRKPSPTKPFSVGRFAGFLAGSIALHAVGVTTLDAPAAAPPLRRTQPVRVQLLAPEPPEPTQPEPPDPKPLDPPRPKPPEPEPEPKPQPAPKASPPVPEPPPQAPPPSEPEPAPEPQPSEPPEPTTEASPSSEPTPTESAPHLLATNNPNAATLLATGRGGSGTRRATGSSPGRVRSAPKAPARSQAVPLSQLSRKPRPPSLDRLLRRNYPKRLRERGIGGEAIVRLRLSARGRVEHVTILSESVSGFGRACRDTLEGTRWTPPLDGRGRAVPTHLSYRCRFSISG